MRKHEGIYFTDHVLQQLPLWFFFKEQRAALHLERKKEYPMEKVIKFSSVYALLETYTYAKMVQL